MSIISTEHFNNITEGPWETVDRTQYRLTIDHVSRTIYVTGQSSRDDDWPDNFDFRKRKPPEQWFPDRKDILVHAGFLRQYKAVRDLLLDVCYKYPDYAIRGYGYSLGTWVHIFIQDILYHWPKRDVQAILYAPINPWRKLPKEYQIELYCHTTFVYCYWDPVTWMRLLGFHRYGVNIVIGKLWRIFPIQHHWDQITRALDEYTKANEKAISRNGGLNE